MTELLNGTGSVPTARLRVLVAEDNEDAADTLQALLETMGYDVSVARSGPAAIESALRERPDVLLCDIGLPGLSGYEVARQLRTHVELADLLMIAVTGYAEDHHQVAAKAAGFDVHVSKSASPLEILGNLERLSRRGTAQPGGEADPLPLCQARRKG